MSGQAVPVDLSGDMLDLEEDEDLEVFTKVKIPNHNRSKVHPSRCGSGTRLQPATVQLL